ncbi:YxiJ family protein [Neobacillus drentensis]
MDKTQIFEELKSMQQIVINPFPYDDTTKMQKDFKRNFSKEDCLNADLNSYWMNIAGCLSKVFRGNESKIPQGQIDWLHLSFFGIFEQYRFLEENISNYPTFYDEYMNNEKARELLLKYLYFN